MAREMAATVLGAGGTPAADAAAAPAADEPERSAPEGETPPDSAPPEETAPEAGPAEAAPDGTPPPDDKRLRDTQAALHKAKAEAKSLAAALSKLMPSAPGAPTAPTPGTYPPVTPVLPSPTPYGAPPTAGQPLNIPLPMTEADFEQAFKDNSNRELDDRTAFRRSFGGLLLKYHEGFMRQVVPQLQVVFSQGTARDLAMRSARARHGNAVKQHIEGYWQSIAPALPSEYIWLYAQEAAQQHPGTGPEAISQQAAYCLSRALERFSGAVAVYRPDHSDVNRVQDALLRPGEGGSLRSARSAPTTNMVDQMRTIFRGVRGG